MMRRTVWMTVFWLLSAMSGLATSVTVQIEAGPEYSLDVQALPVAGGGLGYYVSFAQLASVLRQFDRNARWNWDARTSLLLTEAGGHRFSLSSSRALVAVDERLVPVAQPIRMVQGQTWVPMESVRLIVGSLRGLHLSGPEAIIAGAAVPSTATIVRSPDDVVRGSVLPDRTGPVAAAPGPGGLLNIPPVDHGPSWRVLFDPTVVEAQDLPPEQTAVLRPALAQIADRCATMLREEGSLHPIVLTEHSEATSPELVLEAAAKTPADLVVFLRLESSRFRRAAGYSILYVDESVDSVPAEALSDLGTRGVNYLANQEGSRRLATYIASNFNDIAGFRERHLIPAPLYLLKRCPARSVMVLFSFPQGSSELERFANGGFREDVALRLYAALLEYQRENAVGTAQPSEASGLVP